MVSMPSLGGQSGIRDLEVRGSNPLPGIDWYAFEGWLVKDHRERVVRGIISYGRRYYRCLVSEI